MACPSQKYFSVFSIFKAQCIISVLNHFSVRLAFVQAWGYMPEFIHHIYKVQNGIARLS